MKKLIFLLPILIVIAITISIIILNPNKASTTQNNVQVVAVENFYADIASQIGGSYVNVSNILSDPNADPHAYELTSKDAKLLNSANLIIANGAGYDSFVDKSLSGKKTVIAANIVGVTEGGNPHLWYSVEYIKKISLAIKNQLIAIDSTHAGAYTAQYDTFITSLTLITSAEQHIKEIHSGTSVLATERVADYMLKDSGLTPVQNDFQKAVEEGNDPSVASVTMFQGLIEKRQIAILVYNTQTVSQLTEKMKIIAKDRNIPVVGVSETMPIGSHYVPWILSEVNTVKDSLK